MEKEKIDRINELARIAKERELTDEEKKERMELRSEYLESVRANLRATLGSIDIVDKDGTVSPLKKKD